MNTTLRVSIIVILCVISAAIISLAVYGRYVYLPNIDQHTEEQLFSVVQEENVFHQSRNTIVHAGILLLLTAGTAVFYRKSSYPEIVLFIFGAAMFANLDCYRLIFFLQMSGAAPMYLSIVMRCFFFFWFLGTGIFFIAGLFPNGVPNLKQQEYLLLTAIITFSLVVLMPIDSSLIRTQFPFTTESYSFLMTLVKIVEVSAVLNFLAAALRRGSARLVLAALGLAAFLTGNELFFFDPAPLRIITGSVLILSGALLYVTRITAEYLWS